MAKHDGIFPKTPLARPKFEIYTPKGDDKHPHPFHMWSPPPPVHWWSLSMTSCIEKIFIFTVGTRSHALFSL